MNDESLLRYSRHLLLPEWSELHQQRLSEARVLIMGMGGLGSAVAPYLASSGIGHLMLADFDVISLDNLQRQVLYRTSDLERLKVDAAAEALLALNPTIQIETYSERWSEIQFADHLNSVDVVVDCTDNFEARYAINRICCERRVPLVSGAAVEWEGRLMVFDFRDRSSPCYYCVFPEGEEVTERRCATTGIFAPLVGMIGTLQAAETLKLITETASVFTHRLLSVHLRDGVWRVSGFQADQACPVCGVGN